MQIRKVNSRERIEASNVQCTAFFGHQSEPPKEPEEITVKPDETGRAVFDEYNKLCSTMDLHHYNIRFDGHVVGMGGIGGVATLPEERNKGYVRKLLLSCLTEMKERGMVFSYLYPFSFEYYRQFGYEAGYTKNVYTADLEAFAKFPKKSGSFRQVFANDDFTEISEIYNSFIKDKNLAVVRTSESIKKRFAVYHHAKSIYSYIYINDAGKPMGYIQFTGERNQTGDKLIVNELCWLDYAALENILSFMYGYSGQMKEIVFELPSTFKLLPKNMNLYSMKVSCNLYGMNRIVDAQKALSLTRYATKSGQFWVKVQDNFLDWNNGTYSVEWDENGTRVSADENSPEPDFIIDVRELVQLLTGFVNFEELLEWERVCVKRNDVKDFFMHKALFINDFF